MFQYEGTHDFSTAWLESDEAYEWREALKALEKAFQVMQSNIIKKPIAEQIESAIA